MKHIVVTGGGGFIGSNLVAALAARGTHNVVVCDKFGEGDKWRNLKGHCVWEIIPPNVLFHWLEEHKTSVDAIYHVGAISSTTEKNIDLILEHNLAFSIALWRWCNRHEVRFLYTSSSATYGDGSCGFNDDHSISYLQKLHPLSGYGWSKNLFDMHIAQEIAKGAVRVPQWVALKVFNAYGPNEYHKNSQSSVICQIAPQAMLGAAVKLFKSYNPNYADGAQLRDVIYVKDCVDVMLWLLDNPSVSGMYNLGSGKARTFNDMAAAVFSAIGKKPNIGYIEMPEGLRFKYQYLTEAKMDKLRAAGYTKPFTTVEDGVKDYVQNYLMKDDPYL